MNQTLMALPTATLAFAFLLLSSSAFGMFLVRLLRFQSSNFWTQTCVVLLCGLSGYGHFLLAIGHLHGLSRGVLSVVAVLCALYLATLWSREKARNWWNEIVSQLGATRIDRVLVWSSLLILLIAFVSGLRAWQLSGAGDEQGYHWSAPLFWAARCGWETSPFKLTNSFALAQILHTHSAVFGSFIAAHWTHTTFLIALVLSATSIATNLGARPAPTIAGCLACPVALTQAVVSYNDVAAAAFIMGAFALLLEGGSNRKSLSIGGFLLVSAIAVKPFSIVALPAALWIAVRSPGDKPDEKNTNIEYSLWTNAAKNLAQFILPMALIVALWMLHARWMTGHFWQSEGVGLVRSPDDPMWKSGAATARIPNLRDILMLPTIPFLAPIFGQAEPLGGRTGLLLPFALWGFFQSRSLAISQRKMVNGLIIAASSYFFLLGTIAIKTRFHIFVWMTFAIFAALSFSILTARKMQLTKGASRNWASLGVLIFCVLLWFSTFADAARVMLRNISMLP